MKKVTCTVLILTMAIFLMNPSSSEARGGHGGGYGGAIGAVMEEVMEAAIGVGGRLGR